MFFEVSKMFWQFLKPSHFLFWLALLGVILCFTRFSRVGKFAALAGLLGILAISNIQLGSSSIRAQENNVTPLDLNTIKPDGILVLSGAVNRKVTESRGGLQVYGNADRILEMIRLMSIFPNAKVVYSGGWGDRDNFDKGEADYVRSYMQDLPFDLSKVTFDNRSRNTRENISFSKKLVNPQASEQWILITSAQHIPRAVGEAKAQGWNLVGYPVDYLTTREKPKSKARRSVFSNMATFNHAAYELLGRIAYAISS